MGASAPVALRLPGNVPRASRHSITSIIDPQFPALKERVKASSASLALGFKRGLRNGRVTSIIGCQVRTERQGAGASAASLSLSLQRSVSHGAPRGGSISSIISPQFPIGRQGAGASAASLALSFPPRGGIRSIISPEVRSHWTPRGGSISSIIGPHWPSGSHGEPRRGSISSIISPHFPIGRQGAALAASLALSFPLDAKGRH